MIVLDRMLIGGIRFVLDKIASAVDAELNDADRVRDELLAVQMQLELGEITEVEFARIERDLLARLREIRARQREGPSPADPDYRVAGAVAIADIGDESARARNMVTVGVDVPAPKKRRTKTAAGARKRVKRG